MEQNKPQTEQEISQQAAVRRQKLADLCEAGHNPFEITKYAQDAYSADLKQNGGGSGSHPAAGSCAGVRAGAGGRGRLQAR